MKFKEIKPGMVIHCDSIDELDILLKHLTELGYRGHGCVICGNYDPDVIRQIK